MRENGLAWCLEHSKSTLKEGYTYHQPFPRKGKQKQRTLFHWDPRVAAGSWSGSACFLRGRGEELQRLHICGLFSSFLAFGTNIRLFSWCLWLQGKAFYLKIIVSILKKLKSFNTAIMENVDFFFLLNNGIK